MKIVMNRLTNYNGILREVGKEYTDLPDEVVMRWARNGIASIIEEVVIIDDEDKTPPTLDEMTPKQLFNLCKERGIKLEKSHINGKTDAEKKAYMISMLEPADEEEEEATSPSITQHDEDKQDAENKQADTE